MVFRGAGGAVQFSVSDFSSPPHVGTSGSFEVLPGPFVKMQVIVPGETPAGGTETGVSGTPAAQSAGSGFSIQVRAVDEYFNRVPGVSDRAGLSSTDLFAGMPVEAALTNGEALVSVTLYRAGVQTITATNLDNAGIASHTSSGVPVGQCTWSSERSTEDLLTGWFISNRPSEPGCASGFLSFSTGRRSNTGEWKRSAWNGSLVTGSPVTVTAANGSRQNAPRTKKPHAV